MRVWLTRRWRVRVGPAARLPGKPGEPKSGGWMRPSGRSWDEPARRNNAASTFQGCSMVHSDVTHQVNRVVLKQACIHGLDPRKLSDQLPDLGSGGWRALKRAGNGQCSRLRHGLGNCDAQGFGLVVLVLHVLRNACGLDRQGRL